MSRRLKKVADLSETVLFIFEGNPSNLYRILYSQRVKRPLYLSVKRSPQSFRGIVQPEETPSNGFRCGIRKSEFYLLFRPL